MTQNWRQSTNQQPSTFSLSNINNLIKYNCTTSRSPIDHFYASIAQLITSPDVTFHRNNTHITPLIIVGIISCTENYFRSIISDILSFCSTSRKHAADSNINFGTVLWYNGIHFERGALEHLALSNSDGIVTACKKFVKLDAKKEQNLSNALEQYDKCCELRHCIVHSQNIISGRNATKLELPPNGCYAKLSATYSDLQNIAFVCTNLVKAFNVWLFEELAKRWALELKSVNPNDKKKCYLKFKQIWTSFRSEIDSSNGTIPCDTSLIKCRNMILREFT